MLAGYVKQPGGGAGGDVGDAGILFCEERDGGVEAVAELSVPDVVLAVEAGGSGEVAVEDVGVCVFDGQGGQILEY